MYIVPPLDSASHWLTASNIVYVAGALLTFGAAIHVLLEKRAVLAGRRQRESFWAEASVVIAASVSVLGTIGAIHFSNTVSHFKDVDLATYEKQADSQIAQLNKEAADATESAGDANLKNTQLQIELSSHETTESKAEAELAKENKATSDFAHALAQQQATMAEQAHVSPILTDYQITALAAALGPFRGSDVLFHATSDTTVLRLKRTIEIAFQRAGITESYNSIDMGELYQGVTVAVHDPADVPGLANALVLSLRAAGIDVQTASVPQRVPAGKVALFLGPN